MSANASQPFRVVVVWIADGTRYWSGPYSELPQADAAKDRLHEREPGLFVQVLALPENEWERWIKGATKGEIL